MFLDPNNWCHGSNLVNQYSYTLLFVIFLFVSQSPPIPTYHSAPPPYSQPPPTYNNVTPPSQSNMSNFNPSTEATINNLAQTLHPYNSLASITQSNFNVPTFVVASPLFDDIVYVVPTKYMQVPQLELYNGKSDYLTHGKTFQTLCSDFSHDQRLIAKLFTQTFRDKSL